MAQCTHIGMIVFDVSANAQVCHPTYSGCGWIKPRIAFADSYAASDPYAKAEIVRFYERKEKYG